MSRYNARKAPGLATEAQGSMNPGQGIGPYLGASLAQTAEVRCLLPEHQCLSTDCAFRQLVTVGKRPAFFLDDVAPWPVRNGLIALRIIGDRATPEFKAHA